MKAHSELLLSPLSLARLQVLCAVHWNSLSTSVIEVSLLLPLVLVLAALLLLLLLLVLILLAVLPFLLFLVVLALL